MPTFRVFISSTFADFALERDALQRTVFPRLEAFCRSRGAGFEAVDLRWGISREAAESQGALELCLREIERCQRLSPSPNFLVMVGSRYGWRPAPARIVATEFEAILAALPDAQGRAALTAAYRRDDNAVPPEYRLTLPSSAADCADQEEVLRALLERGAMLAALPGARALIYRASATHQEIVRGFLAHPGAGDHVVAVLREIPDLPAGDPRAAAFIDTRAAGEADGLAAAAVAELKQALRERLSTAARDIQAHWDGDGLSGRHLPAFCEHVETQLRTKIEAQLAAMRASVDDGEDERAQHAAFGRARREVFVARDADLERALALLSRTDRARPGAGGWLARLLGRTPASEPAPPTPIVVLAEGGAGKSAFLAALVARAVGQVRGRVAIERYIGASALSSSLPALVHGICREIDLRYGTAAALPPPTDWVALADAFRARLLDIPAREPLLLVIDALDQLEAGDHGLGWTWLPLALPPQVRVVLSSRADARVDSLLSALPPQAVLRLQSLGTDHAWIMLEAWLAASGRRLQPAQKDAIAPSLARSPPALYVKLVHELAKHWPGWQAPGPIPDSVAGLVDRLLAQLGAAERHGETLVRSALSHLALARAGLGNAEMQAVLAADPEVVADFRARAIQRWHGGALPPILWTRLYFDLESYLRESATHGSTVYAFFHREIAERIRERVARDDAAARHGRIARVLDDACADLFEGVGTADPAAFRVLVEKPFQLVNADAARAQHLLACLDFPMAKLRAGMLEDLLHDYASALAASADAARARHMRDFIASHAHLLRRAREGWPAERILLQLAAEQPAGSVPREASEAWLAGSRGRAGRDWEWLRDANPGAEADAASAAPVTIEAGFAIEGMHWLRDGRLLVFGMDRLNLIDAASGKVLMDLPIPKYAHRASPLAGGRILFEGSAARVWNADTGHFLAGFEHEDIRSTCELRDGRILLGLFRGFGVWDPATRKFTLCGSTEEPVMGLAELPSAAGGLVLTWGWSVQLWRIGGGAAQAERVGILEPARTGAGEGRDDTWYVQREDLLVTAQGRVVFRSTDGGVHAFSVVGGVPARLWEHRDAGTTGIRVLGEEVLCLRDYAGEHLLLDADGKPVQCFPKSFTGGGSELVHWDADVLMVLAPDYPLCAWQRNGELRWQFGIEGERNFGAVALAGGQVAVSSSRGVFVLDPDTGAVLFQHAMFSGAGGHLLVSPDGRGVAVSVDRSVRIWPDVARPGRVEERSGRFARAPRCVPLARGRALVQGAGAAIIDTDTGEALCTSRGAGYAAATPHGVLMACGGTVELRDAQSGGLLASASGHVEPVTASCASEDGRLVTLSKDALVARDPASLDEAARSDSAFALKGLLPLADGVILAWREDGTVIAWSPGTAAVELGRHAGTIGGAVALPGRPRAAVTHGDDGLRSWDLATGSAIAHYADFDAVASEWGSVGGVADAAALADGRIVAWGRCERDLRVFKAPVFEQCVRIPCDDQPSGVAVLAGRRELLGWNHDTLWLRRLDEALSLVFSMKKTEAALAQRALHAVTCGMPLEGEPWHERWSLPPLPEEYRTTLELTRHEAGSATRTVAWEASDPVAVVRLLADAVLVADAFGRVRCLHLHRGGARIDF